MIKFNLLKKEEEKEIAILCFNIVDFNRYVNEHSHKLCDMYGENINFIYVNKYDDIKNKNFLTYRSTIFFSYNSNYNNIIREIQHHINI